MISVFNLLKNNFLPSQLSRRWTGIADRVLICCLSLAAWACDVPIMNQLDTMPAAVATELSCGSQPYSIDAVASCQLRGRNLNSGYTLKIEANGQSVCAASTEISGGDSGVRHYQCTLKAPAAGPASVTVWADNRAFSVNTTITLIVPPAFKLSSSAFNNGSALPTSYWAGMSPNPPLGHPGCAGSNAMPANNTSPPLNWVDPPASTQSFALIMADTSPTASGYKHWSLWNIPANQTSLASAVAGAQSGALAAVVQGTNSSGSTGYSGPCPPSNTHSYTFTLYALNVSALTPSNAATDPEALSATLIQDPNKILGTAILNTTANAELAAQEWPAPLNVFSLTRGTALTARRSIRVLGGVEPLLYRVSPALPAGLSFNTSTGEVSGTPSATQASTSYTVTVTDAAAQTGTGIFTLVVEESLAATVRTPSYSLVQNTAMSSNIPVLATGGVSPYTYRVAPALPAGLSFNTSTGAVSGTPSATQANTSYTVTVTDGSSQTATGNFTITIRARLVTTANNASLSLTQGVSANQTPVSASGGVSPYTYSVTPALPTGLSFSTSTGAVSGTPSATQANTSYTVTVTDGSSQTATGNFTITIRARLVTTANNASLSLTQGVSANQTPVSASGGVSPYTYSVTPALPPGLSLDRASGLLTGIANSTQATNTYTVLVQDNAAQSASAAFALSVRGTSTIGPWRSDQSGTFLPNGAISDIGPSNLSAVLGAGSCVGEADAGISDFSKTSSQISFWLSAQYCGGGNFNLRMEVVLTDNGGGGVTARTQNRTCINSCSFVILRSLTYTP